VNTLFLDTETFSPVPITHGTHAYAEQAEVILVSLAVDDDPVQVWDTSDPERRGSQLASLQHMVDLADEVVLHNSHFDRTVLRHCGVKIPVDKITDTMVLALQHSLPASLAMLCDVLGVPQDKAKDKAGKKLIQLLTKPRPKNVKLRRATRETHPDEWQAFIEYARLDVDAMRDVYRRLPRWNNSGRERNLWLADQAINDRGVAVDRDLARSAQRAFERTTRALAARTARLTGGVVASLTQRQKLLDYLAVHHNFVPEDMTKGTVAALLKGDLDPKVRELLEIRQQASATSPAKYDVILNAASTDGRLRGTIQFCGASRTGRDAGRIFQPQNLPRPVLKPDVIEQGIEAMKLDCEDLLFGNVSELCSSAVRGCLVAPPGRKLVVADLSNIEGRVLAWLAGEDWKVRAFYDFDRGTGHDLYKLTAGRILNKDPGDITRDERQVSGKVPELACLGPDTRVLTSNGVKAITKVTTDDLLWDGEQWVTHTGLLDRGQKQTIWLDGAEMTADHLVLVNETWLSAQTAASSPNFRDQALATGAESLRSSGWTSEPKAVCASSSCNVHVAQRLTALMSAIGAKAPALAATPAPSVPQESGPNRGFDMRMSAPTMHTDVACVTAYRLASIGATTPTTTPTPIMAAGVSMSTSHGELTGRHISRILSHWMAGIGPNWNWTELITTGVTSRVISVSSENEPIVTTCDMYEPCSSASTNLRRVYDIANAGPRNRFTILTDTGALVVHNCGYQGSVGAFAAMGALYGVVMPEEEALEIVQAWRKQHPMIVRLWYDVERAALSALKKPDDEFAVRSLRLSVKRWNGQDWLCIKLPSGRYLCYPNAHRDWSRTLANGETMHGPIGYDGIDQYTKQWTSLGTYGGKLVENIVQAVARDIFMGGMLRAEAEGYPVVIRVHDELICETPDDPAFTVAALSDIMTRGESWTTGLPLAAAGHEMHRYAKLD
jgi:hypothetical protein